MTEILIAFITTEFNVPCLIFAIVFLILVFTKKIKKIQIKDFIMKFR